MEDIFQAIRQSLKRISHKKVIHIHRTCEECGELVTFKMEGPFNSLSLSPYMYQQQFEKMWMRHKVDHIKFDMEHLTIPKQVIKTDKYVLTADEQVNRLNAIGDFKFVIGPETDDPEAYYEVVPEFTAKFLDDGTIRISD